MKKYLREIEIAGMILLIIGIVIALTAGYQYGAFPCGIGMLLLLVMFLYKAFHWKEYERENKQYIIIIIATTLILLMQMMRIK